MSTRYYLKVSLDRGDRSVVPKKQGDRSSLEKSAGSDVSPLNGKPIP
ncbi:hypothetical protein [Niallia endozanthoxylica]|nr:hypothetical protein [Niallia endozanthoxylica]